MIKKIFVRILLSMSLATVTPVSADLLSSAKDMMGDDALTSSLAGGLGLDSEQVSGGLGSILSLAQHELPKPT